MGSRLGLGTHSLHRLLSSAPRRQLLALAYDLRIRYFDTAPSYGTGLAQREIGRFAQGRRSSMILATKFGIPPGRLASRLPAAAYWAAAGGLALGALGARRGRPRPPHRDYRPECLRPSVESSLRELRTDHLDILYLHEPTADSIGDAGCLVEALQGLRQTGKVRRIGLSRAAKRIAQILHGATPPWRRCCSSRCRPTRRVCRAGLLWPKRP